MYMPPLCMQLRELSDCAARREELTALKQALVTFDMASRLQVKALKSQLLVAPPTRLSRGLA